MSDPIYLQLENEKGESTGKLYSGEFKLVKYLTNKERGDVSRYLEFLAKEIDRDTNVLLLYQAVAHLKVHVVEAPSWWKESDHGMKLLDTAPVFAIYGKLIESQKPPEAEAKPSEDQPKPTK